MAENVCKPNSIFLYSFGSSDGICCTYIPATNGPDQRPCVDVRVGIVFTLMCVWELCLRPVSGFTDRRRDPGFKLALHEDRFVAAVFCLLVFKSDALGSCCRSYH